MSDAVAKEGLFHLAQINIAKLVAPLTDPRIAGFVARLDEINALADRSPGFVWRLQTPEGDATQLRPYPDDRTIVNVSVWDSLLALQNFVFRSGHVELVRKRAEWFERMDAPYVALWWLPAGTVPTVEDAVGRLAHLRAHGATPTAFPFGKVFAPESGAGTVRGGDSAGAGTVSTTPAGGG